MRKLLLTAIFIFTTGLAYAQTGNAPIAGQVRTNTTNFDGVLSPTENTVQKALDVIDDAVGGTASTFPAGCTAASNWCLIFDGVSTVRHYVNATLVHSWTATQAVTNFTMMNGNNMVLMNGNNLVFMN